MNTPLAESLTYRLTGEIDGETLLFILKTGDNHIGSHPDNPIRLAAPQISRKHAVITVDGEGGRLADLKSKNGTFVNGVKVRKKRLKTNDWIQFGPVILTFEALHGDDHLLGISTGGNTDPAVDRSDRRLHDESRSTEFGLSTARIQPWIDALNACSIVMFGSETPDIGLAVAALAQADDSAGFVLLRSDHSTPATVEACGGDPNGIGAFDPGAISGLHPGQGCKPHIGALSLDLDRPSIAIVQWSSTGWASALVVLGIAIPSSLRPLLEMALRLLISGGDHEPLIPQAETESGLCFPSWHVVSHSDPMRKLYDQMAALCHSTMPILVTGETGVGKEHIVRILHDSSNRAKGPLQIVNCTAIPKDLLEAEVFGIEKGIATGVGRRDGKMRLADGGTLFLDEIGDMDFGLQGKLLRALQEGKVHPVGAPSPIPVDVRIVAATHTILADRVRQGRFREDLYYRIAGCELHVPALREHRKDIPALVRHFLQRALDENGKSLRGLSVKALENLVNAQWPGNIRQLQREVERLVALCPAGQTIESTMISPMIFNDDTEVYPEGATNLHLKRRLAALEHTLILQAIERSAGNHSEAARLLGVTRNGLTMKMSRLGIST